MSWTASHLASRKLVLGNVQNGKLLETRQEEAEKGSFQQKVNCFRQGHLSLGDGRGLSGRLPSAE